jgi:protease PrsW
MHALVALLPALLFLTVLLLMDSFKLVRPATVGLALTYGAVAAMGSEWVSEALLAKGWVDIDLLTRYVAPVIEEVAKAGLIALLLWRRRLGFVVDAAVVGFAIGTGFGVLENFVYLREFSHAPMVLWLVRGLGTAMLHGATTGIVAMIGKTTSDRHSQRPVAFALVPGLVVAAVIHSAYNHQLLPPVVATGILLVLLPLVVIAVFERSEKATREWVGAGLDLDIEVLQLILSEHFQITRFGSYLRELRSRFDGAIVADMFCLLRLELELSVQAKARLIAREAGLEIPVDSDLTEALAEHAWLRRSIGPTGLLALKPLQVTSHRDDWHRYLLSQAGTRARITGRLRGR